MRSPDWDRLEELFQTAVTLSPTEREGYLQGRCREADSLRAQVTALLEAHDEAESFLEQPAMAEAAGGWRIGPYEIIRELGRGGMGTVFLARRVEVPNSPPLAIKVIGTDLHSKLALARFSQEKRTLATLHHRNIASFLDGGTTDSGQPYLVMEYVDGQPIDRFCDRRKLPVRERIELFLFVCSAIRHAHQKLVIHRDLKPGNVLVTEEGVVKVVDFGTAKLLDPALRLPGLASTVAGYLPMTPRYASPEQVRGEPITTMTDVYGLGTLLYELMTGRGVHRFTGANPAEIVRAVCEEQPEKPSAVLRKHSSARLSDEALSSASTSSAIAELRGTQPTRLQRSLAGDLDKILMKALRKEPAERYGSVESLAEDLKRYLDGLPVFARTGSWLYRSRKFHRRNRAGVLAATIALTSLLLFALSSTRQAMRTELQRQDAELEREKAETVSVFLVGLFEGAGAGGPEESEQVLALLDRGAQRLRRVPNPRPTIQASLLEASGKAYRRLGFYDRAEPYLVDALELRRGTFGEEHLDTASSLHELGFLRFRQGEKDDAEALMLRALGTRERLGGTGALVVAESLDGLAELGIVMGWKNAEDHALRALEIRSQLLDDNHPDVGFSQANLGNIMIRLGKYQDGLALLEAGFANVEKALGSRDLQTADIAFGYGSALRKLGQYGRAEEMMRLAMSAYKRSLGSDHPFSAACHSELGGIHLDRHDPDSAEPEYRKALELSIRRFGPEHPWIGSTLHNLGRTCYQRGDLACAADGFQKSREMLDRVLGPDSLYSSFPIHYQGILARLNGDYLEAEPLLLKALAIRRRHLPENHLDIATSLGGLGRLYLDRGEVSRAEPLLRQTLEIRQASFDTETLWVASALIDLAEVEKLRDRPGRALTHLEQALKFHRRVLGEDHELSLAVAEQLAGARQQSLTPARRRLPSGQDPQISQEIYARLHLFRPSVTEFVGFPRQSDQRPTRGCAAGWSKERGRERTPVPSAETCQSIPKEEPPE